MGNFDNRYSPGVARAIREAGSIAKFARKVGVKPQAVLQWQKLPLKRMFQIEEMMNIPRSELRPDLYGQPQVTVVPEPPLPAAPAVGDVKAVLRQALEGLVRELS
jgi:hypothetical protein